MKKTGSFPDTTNYTGAMTNAIMLTSLTGTLLVTGYILEGVLWGEASPPSLGLTRTLRLVFFH